MTSNWGVAGGIGQGVMQGLGFLRQMDADKRSQQMLENQSEVLGMQKDIHREKMGEIARKDRLVKGFQSIAAEPGLSDAERYSKFAAEHAKDMTPDEHVAIGKVVKPMLDIFGKEALDKAIFGKDLSGLEKVVGMRHPGSKVSFGPDGNSLVVTTPDAKATPLEWGNFSKTYGISSYLEEQEKKSKIDLERRKMLAEIDNKNADTRLKDRLPQDRIGGAGGGRGAGGKEPKPFSLDINEMEKITPIDPATGKPDPQKLASIAANAESIFNLNPAIREKSPYAAYQIAAGIEKGDIKPELLRDPATNSYYKAVKYGSSMARIGDDAEADPDAFYANNPAAIKVRINNDRAWLDQYTKSIPDPKQRETMSLALRADTPQGAAARNEIIAAYNQIKSSGQPVPDFLRQKYSALQTADRLKSAPPEAPEGDAKAAPKRVRTPDETEMADTLGLDLDDPGLAGRLSALGNRFLNAIGGAIDRGKQNNVESQLLALQRNPEDRSVREWLFARSVGNPELQARIKAALGRRQ